MELRWAMGDGKVDRLSALIFTELIARELCVGRTRDIHMHGARTYIRFGP